MNLLSIDFGTRNIGLGIARGPLAEPYKLITGNWAKQDAWKYAIAQLVEICQKEEIEKIIVGLSENQMAQMTKDFIVQLQAQIDLPIEYIDETLSSHEMHLKLNSSKKKKKSGPIDHFVAAELLQEWLDS